MDRRRAARRIPATDEPLVRAKLRTGSQLVVVDASSWGVMTETTERLLPGRHLDVHVVTPGGRVLVRGRVARAYVYMLRADAIAYRAALAFDQPIDTRACGYPMPPVFASAPAPPGMPYPDQTGDGDIAFDERLTA